MDSLCHPWFTTANLSYRFPIFETSATALCGTTGRGLVVYLLILFAGCKNNVVNPNAVNHTLIEAVLLLGYSKTKFMFHIYGFYRFGFTLAVMISVPPKSWKRKCGDKPQTYKTLWPMKTAMPTGPTVRLFASVISSSDPAVVRTLAARLADRLNWKPCWGNRGFSSRFPAIFPFNKCCEIFVWVNIINLRKM